MDSAFVDKQASQNSGVNFFLLAVDVFSQFVSVQTMKTKYASFQKLISRKITPENFGSVQEQIMGEISKKLCREKDLGVYSTMSWTKAAFAERAMQSLKHIIYRYIENHGKKFNYELPQFVSTMNCRVNRFIGKSPRIVKNTDFLPCLYKKPLTKHKKPKLKNGAGVRIST